MKTFFRRSAVFTLCLCLLLGTASLFSCGQNAPTLAELDGTVISVNMFQFMLSRIKGNLGRSGYPVDRTDFWDTIVSKDNTTYDQYFRQSALVDARRYLAALTLYEEYGLDLPQRTLDKIDEDIDAYIRTAGSKSALNAELSVFGVNVDMLRDIYIMEAKFDQLQEHVYGKDGAKVSAEVRQEYLAEHAVCFRYVLIRSFDFVYETDTNGDIVYYLPRENNGKVNNIAYDKEAGKPREDANGKEIVDANNDVVYYLPNGSIAYDTEKGVRATVLDEKGMEKTSPYSSEELAENKAAGEELLATVEKGDYAAFEALLDEYELEAYDAFEPSPNYETTYSFLYTTGDNGDDFLNDVSDTLAGIDEGELRMLSSEYGYYVVMKYPMPSDAVTNSAHAESLGSLVDRVVAELFNNLCQPYMDRVTVSNEAFAELPSMKEIGANYYY